jgi:alpha-ketoglutarate-dependent 2,4-dichlorophenoxyacetate dioxygenase
LTLAFRKLHPHFVAEVSGIDLRQAHDPELLERLRAGMDEHAVLVFRDQPLTNDEQLAFAQRFDGTLHTKTSVAVLAENRYG